MAVVYGLYPDLPKFKDVRGSLKTHPTKKYPILSMSSKKEVAVHHSLTRRGLSGSNAEGYAGYHVGANNWPGIAYSYVIEPDGTIKFCNPINWRTYHVGNSNNIAVGIVLTGDFRYEDPTPEQEESLRILVARIKKDQKQIQVVRSHDEYPGYDWKSCCEFDYRKVLSSAAAITPTQTTGDKYTIQEGDTFWSIAKGKDFEAIDLEHANPGLDARSLKIGEVITLPTGGNKATPEEKQDPAYHGNSISKYLESIGENGSYENREKLAAKYGIKNYVGTASQNLQLLAIIRDGAKAPTTETVTTVKSITKGQTVTVPAGKLYAQGNAVNPVKNAKLTAKVESINNSWRNSVRLTNSNGAYVGFARLSDLGGVTTPTVTTSSTIKVGDKVTAKYLYGSSSDTSADRSTPITGYVEKISNSWKNPYRLVKTKGKTDYLGFARKEHLSK